MDNLRRGRNGKIFAGDSNKSN
jgi:hypothetical protein